jgi:hypothetical protein
MLVVSTLLLRENDSIKKVMLILVFSLAVIAVLVLVLPPVSYKVDISYKGYAYKQNTPDFSAGIDLKLEGEFDRKAREFRGIVHINGTDYRDCRISPASGFFCDASGSSLQFFGMSYSNSKFDNLTFNITDSPLYYQLTGEDYTEDLIISIPAQDRASALNVSNKLKHQFLNSDSSSDS